VSAVTAASTKTIGLNDSVGTSLAIIIGFTLRLVAYRRGWRLPQGLEWQPRGVIQPRQVARRSPDEEDPPPGKS